MDDFKMRFYTPVVTGNPQMNPVATGYITNGGQKEIAQSGGFEQVLRQQLLESQGVSFSKHAIKRAAEKNIEISAESLARLNEGVRMAEEKNLGDTLIMVDKLAFVVNVRNQTVITAMKSGDKANIFTNIEGTVIV